MSKEPLPVFTPLDNMTEFAQHSNKQPVAIVGISAELPSGSYAPKNLGYKEFAEFLLHGGKAYEEIPRERFNIDSWAGDGLGRVTTRKGSFLKDVADFDHSEFGISAKDARAMAISTRKLIELSFLSLLDAGIDYRGHNVGCYAAATAHDILAVAEPDEMEAQGSFAGIPCMVANKISYHLDLRGPSVPIDTACSSSLTALHLAVQALRMGECESAVVAACQLNLRLADFVQYSQGSVLAPDGECKSFDASADGFARGEGAVAIVLKLYEDAVRDGDYIYGNVLGTGINASGGVSPAYAPVGNAQADAMHRAYHGIGRNPREVDFVEMHATGTAAGDPIESNWVGEKFARDEELLIGSVKGNIGHLEVTAFLASLCKVCSIFETSVILPNVNLTVRNPAIKWDAYKLKVPLEPTPVTPRSPSRRLLVSMGSSGIGGSNGHAVLESVPRSTVAETCKERIQGPVLLLAGGLSPRSGKAVADSLAELSVTYPERWDSLSYVYGRRTKQMTWRTYTIAVPDRQPQSALQFTTPVLIPRNKPPMIFLFSGQGPQHINMGKQLYERFPVFRDTIMQLDERHQAVTGTSLIRQYGIFEGTNPLQDLPPVWPVSVILPSIAMVQIALFDLLYDLGLRPDIVIGHSAGETAMLYASGAAPKEMAMEIAIARGKVMTIIEREHGTMAALACTPTQAGSIIQTACHSVEREGILEIACYNSPSAVAISGHDYLVEKAIELAKARGFLAQRIQTEVPVHSSLMDICQEEYKSAIADIYARYPGEYKPRIETYSTESGDRLGCFSVNYFWKNSRNPVQFTRAVGAIQRAHPDATFLEISPHPVLSSYVQELGFATASISCPMRRSKKYEQYQEEVNLLNALGRITLMGHNAVDFRKLISQTERRHDLEHPPYPFMKKHVPYLPVRSRILRKQMTSRGPLSGEDLRINSLTHPDVAQHIINNEPIMPAAGFLEMALEAGARSLWNVQFHSMLSLSSETPTTIVVDIDRMRWSVKSLSSSKTDGGTEASRLHISGYMTSDYIPDAEQSCVDLAAIRTRCEARNVKAFYEGLAHFAQYGSLYRRATEIHLGYKEALVKVRGAGSDISAIPGYIIHPAVLDACMHVAVHPDFTGNPDRDIYYLPSRLGKFVLHDLLKSNTTLPDVLYAHAVLKQWLPGELVTDVYVADVNGKRICTLQDIVVERHFNVSPLQVAKRFDLVNQRLQILPRRFEESDLIDLSRSDKARDGTLFEPEASVDSVESQLRVNSAEFENATLTDVLRMCEDGMKHIVNVSGKRVVDVLVLDEGSLHFSHALSTMIERVFGTNATIRCFVAADGEEESSPRSLPQFCFTAQVDLLGNHPSPGPYGIFFDMAVSFHALAPRGLLAQYLQYLRGVLLPGGLLFLAENVDDPTITEAPILDTRNGSSLAPHLPHPVELSSQKQWLALLESQSFRATLHLCRLSDALLIEAQRSMISLAGSESSTEQDLVLLTYALGSEMTIQQALKTVDPNHPRNIWFTAVAGANGDGAKGFTRSLRREFPLWDVGLVIFQVEYAPHDVEGIVRHYASMSGMEREIFVDEKLDIWVSRFCESHGPTTKSSFREEDIASDVPQLHAKITVLAASLSDAGCYGIIGRVDQLGAETDPLLLNAVVATVALAAPTSSVVVHVGAVSPVPVHADFPVVAQILPAFLLAGTALGLSFLQNPHRTWGGRVTVTHSDSPMGQSLLWLLGILGITATVSMPSSASPLDFLSLHPRLDDVVLSGYDQDDQLLDEFIGKGSSVLCWRVCLKVAHTLATNPWVIGDTLHAALRRVQQRPLPASLSLEGKAEPSTSASSSSRLFKSDQTYLFIGGIGSLGIHIALWMYENGARHIVMTSRSGRASLQRANNVLVLHTLEYLSSLPDLSLRLEACDAACVTSLKHLLKSITRPIAGCMFMPGVLSDRTFLLQDSDSFDAVFYSKIKTFEALQATINVHSLDFLIIFSSIATFGNAGQTNYASANTVLDGKAAQYDNAFSIIIPTIKDSVAVKGREFQLQHLLKWGFSARELCDCLEDGIRKLADGPFNLYVPDFDWDLVHEHLGSSPLYDHLVRHRPATGSTISSTDLHEQLRGVVLQHLDADPSEFSANVPFTTYGLDSLSAGQLSLGLQPYLKVSQMQLLGDMTLADVQNLAELTQKDGNRSDVVPDSELFQWEEMNRSGQPLVKLVDSGDIPLILMHGGSGSIIPFIPLQERFTTSLWALQITPETPTNSVEAMARFYVQTIKAAQPYGPYRLGAYSGTSIIAIMMARIIEDGGDEVVQLCFVDHFALLYVSPYLQPDEETARLHIPGKSMIRRGLDAMLRLYKAEMNTNRPQLAKLYEDAADSADAEVPMFIRDWLSAITKIVVCIYKFLFELLPEEQPYSVEAIRGALVGWIKEVRAPITVFAARKGALSAFPKEDRSSWEDYGVHRVSPSAKVFSFDEGHFSIMESEELVHLLETEWSR